MNTKQDKWIDEIMGSLQQMQPAEGNPHLHTRVMAKLSQPIARQPLQLKWVYSFSAVFAIMLMLNVMGWNGSTDSSSEGVTSQPVDIETVITEYGLETNYTSLP